MASQLLEQETPELIEPDFVKPAPRIVTLPDRTPPQNVELEMCVLGGIMIEPKAAYPIAADYLTKDSFYLDGHGIVFELMGELYARGIPPDVQSLLDELHARSLLDKVGGGAVLMGMLNAVPTAANVEYHSRKVAEKAQLRLLIRSCTEIIDECYRQEMPADEVLNTGADVLHKLAAGGNAADIVPISQPLGEYMVQLGQRAEARERGYPLPTGLKTGFAQLDRLTGGLKPKQSIIVAASAKRGKSTLAQNIAYHLTVREHTPVALFSMEMSSEEIAERMTVMASLYTDRHDLRLRTISSLKLADASLSADEWAILQGAFEQVHSAPLFICDRGTQTLASIRRQLSALIRRAGVKLGIVDYLQIMTAPPGTPNKRYEEVTQLSRGLKRIAQDLRIPIIVISQLKRIEGDREPRLSDLRESGQIEQDADMVLFIHPLPQDDASAKAGELPQAKLILAAQRNGPTGKMDMHWFKQGYRFLDAAPEQTPLSKQRSMAVVTQPRPQDYCD